jgi:hypothetical protein
MKERLDAANAAAPYFAPKLAQIEQKTEVTVRHVISAEPLSEDQWLITHGSEPIRAIATASSGNGKAD